MSKTIKLNINMSKVLQLMNITVKVLDKALRYYDSANRLCLYKYKMNRKSITVCSKT